MVARTFPALQLNWRSPPEAGAIERVLAEIDADAPTAVEDLANGIRVFFPSAAQRDRALTRVRECSPTSVCAPVDIPDEDWAARSQASLGPVTIDRIVVAPPWATGPDRPDRIQLVIQPSMGFGTGHHASTRLCLRLLQRLDVPGKRVLDVGTGSGVLALAAARLGAGRVLAIDSDTDALGSAADNLRLNGMPEAVELRQIDLEVPGDRIPDRFDIVLANLTGFLLSQHASTLGSLAAERGILVVGGFERHEVDGVRAAYRAAGWGQDLRLDEDGWTGLTLDRLHQVRSLKF
jgi:ribosomal protein L11 methyltransferase